MKKGRIALLVVAVCVFGVYLGIVVFLWEMPFDQHSRREVDAIVVLGCRVLPDGSPSIALENRARRGAQLYLRRRAPVLVFTGGVGEHGESEARVASNVAIEMGVPRSAIRLEERSTSTLENAEFVARDFSFLRVEIVTDNYHALRARRVFKKKFDDVTVSTVRTRFPIVLWNATREAGALLFYAVTGRL